MYTLGIDIGSTATKAVVLKDGKDIAASAIISFGAGTSGTDQALTKLFNESGLTWDDIDYTVATGYGRLHFDKADKQISELSCHARGMFFTLPEARTIIDIGGQDVKVLRLNDRGGLENFIMNEKCAAGTGRFLDVMAGVLETTTDQLGTLDAQSDARVEISSTCTVFAESEVISHLANKEKIPNIIAGIHDSVAKRTAGLARRLGVEEVVVMSGGVAQNAGVVRALEEELGVKIAIPPQAQLIGALGAALYAAKEAERRNKKQAAGEENDSEADKFATAVEDTRAAQPNPNCMSCVG
jgi:predicted CoA-substrate-specific enzyme activase